MSQLLSGIDSNPSQPKSGNDSVSKSLDEEDHSVLSEMKFHWTLSNDKLTITIEGNSQSSSSDTVFEGNNKYYTVMQRGTVSEKIGWQRM